MATTSVPPPEADLKGDGLERGSLNFRNCLDRSVAVMAPVAAAILNAPAVGASPAKALPLAYLQRNSPEKLAALGATMATDGIDFAEAKDLSLSSGDVHRDVEPGHP